MQPATAVRVEFVTPDQLPPPRNKKLILLSRYGIASFGHWQDGGFYVAWAFTPKVPKPIKDILR